MDIATRIKRIREYRNYTQSYMATKLKISQNTYSKLESGVTGIKTDRLEKIAKILEVPIDKIVDGDLLLFNFDHKSDGKTSRDVIAQMEKIIHHLEEEVRYLREQNTALVKTLGQKLK